MTIGGRFDSAKREYKRKENDLYVMLNNTNM
jgi:hypothetical protein